MAWEPLFSEKMYYNGQAAASQQLDWLREKSATQEIISSIL